jgi:hypothetical protein
MPKGMTMRSNNLNLVIKARLWMSLGAIVIYQNHDCRSNAKNHYDLPN